VFKCIEKNSGSLTLYKTEWSCFVLTHDLFLHSRMNKARCGFFIATASSSVMTLISCSEAASRAGMAGQYLPARIHGCDD